MLQWSRLTEQAETFDFCCRFRDTFGFNGAA